MRIESDPTSSPQDDEQSLDRLLGQARWPAMESQASGKLRTTLAGQAIRASKGHSQRWGVAVAAGIIFALIGGALLIKHRQNSQQTVLTKLPLPTMVAVLAKPVRPPIVGRPANAFEYAVLLSNSEIHFTAASKVAAPPSVAAAPPPADVPALIKSLDDPSKREAAIALLARTANPATLVQLAYHPRTKPDTQNALCTALLTRGDVAGTDGFLQLVQNQPTRDLALNALHDFDHPPVQLLLNQLNHPLMERRFAAARALGCLCHGPTFAVLRRMVEFNDHRREAMVALLYCPNPAAKQYLDQLRSRPVLKEQLQAIKNDRDIFGTNL